MCGIAGQLLHAPRTPEAAVLDRMAAAMANRGPDDQGIFADLHIGLVHRRLSIRDLSSAGHCPMPSPDGRLQVTFNGEIYNWRELRAELEREGQAFVSQSDTEVVVKGYARWGLDLLPRLRGMFAVAIWDAAARRLVLARDRMGEKPLFYWSDARQVAFGSSTQAVLPAIQRREIDPVGLGAYLAHGFIPSACTVWQGLNVLPPAHALIVEPGEAPRLQRYWDLPRTPPRRASVSACEAEGDALLDDCVERCLDADVPVGVFLSGGVDSSLVAALVAQRRADVPAFSLGFADSARSELPYARRVATHLGMPHHTVEISARDVADCLPHLVREYGQPFGDSSAVPSYCVARLARRHVTVCLGGDGGDESFGGYWRVQAGLYAAAWAAAVPRPLRAGAVPAIANRLGAAGARLKAMNALSLAAPGAGHTNSQSWLNRLDALAGPALRPALAADLVSLRVGKALDRPEASLIQRLLYDDFQVQLPDAYLTKVDVASMAASLEVRSPLLDQALVEWAWSLPDRAKINLGRRKHLLKRIAMRHVPADVITRPKMGFGMPLAEWFRAGVLKDMIEDLLETSVAVSEGWIRAEAVRQALAEHQTGIDRATRLWLFLWLELWFREVWIPSRTPKGPA